MARPRDATATVLLLVAGFAAAGATLADWFVRPAPVDLLDGYDAFRDARWVAVAVLLAATAWWCRAVIRRARSDADPSMELTGSALVLAALILVCAPFVALGGTRTYSYGRPTENRAVLCPAVIGLTSIPDDHDVSAVCGPRREPRLAAAAMAATVGVVLRIAAGRRRAMTGPLTQRRAVRSHVAQFWVVSMAGALARMAVTDPGRFFLLGKPFAMGAAAAAIAGWLLIVDRSARRDDPRRRSWLAGVLLLELAVVLLLTPYPAGRMSCANPLGGALQASGPDDELVCAYLGILGSAVATIASVAGCVLLLLGPPRVTAADNNIDNNDESWAAAP